jgi:hypothetical protein
LQPAGHREEHRVPDELDKRRKDDWLDPWRLNPLFVTLAGLPEMDYFESDENRQAALRRIAQAAGRPTSWGYWSGVGLTVGLCLGVMALSRFLLRFVQWPTLMEKALSLGLVIAVGLVLIRRLHRQNMPRMLRQELLGQGVPVCMTCGYLLRGMPLAPGRCPECSRKFDGRVRELLGAAR